MNRTHLLFAVVAAWVCSACAFAQEANKTTNDIFAVNTDNGHFFAYRSADEMTMQELHAWVDQYADSKVTHLFICPNARRASFRSKTREAIWDPTDGVAPDHRWPTNAKILHDKGIDPYQVWIDRCREKNISVWLSMRMNDMHQAEDFDNFQHSSFWRENIDLWREPHHEHGSGLNFAYKEVRRYELSFVKELLQRYDLDGIELDWMRNPSHLSPDKAFEERVHLTSFMLDVKALVEKWSRRRGHKIGVSVRTPTHPDACAGVGIDVIDWAHRGVVDLIVATPFYFSSDFDIPFHLWKERLQGTPKRVSVIGGIESTARPWIFGTPVGNTLSTLYGFAAVGHMRGADGFYLFNWMDRTDWPIPYSTYPALLNTGLGVELVTNSSRRHPVCFRDVVPDGFPSDTQLPVDASAISTIRIQAGTKPQSGQVSIIVGLAKREGVTKAVLEGSLNGQDLAETSEFKFLKQLGGDSARAISFSCPLDCVKSGYNNFKIKQANDGVPQQIVWIELRIDAEE